MLLIVWPTAQDIGAPSNCRAQLCPEEWAIKDLLQKQPRAVSLVGNCEPGTAGSQSANYTCGRLITVPNGLDPALSALAGPGHSVGRCRRVVSVGDHLFGAQRQTSRLATLTQTAHHAAAGIASGWRDGSAAACSMGRSCGGEGRLPPGPLLCPHRACLLSAAGYVPCPVQRWMSSAAALAQPLEDLPPYASNVRRRGF